MAELRSIEEKRRRLSLRNRCDKARSRKIGCHAVLAYSLPTILDRQAGGASAINGSGFWVSKPQQEVTYELEKILNRIHRSLDFHFYLRLRLSWDDNAQHLPANLGFAAP